MHACDKQCVLYVLCFAGDAEFNTSLCCLSDDEACFDKDPPRHRCGGVSAKGCEEPFKAGGNSETQDGKLKGKCADEDFNYSLCGVSDDSLSDTESTYSEGDYSWLGGGDHPMDSLADGNNSSTSSSTSGDGSDDDGRIGSMCHDGDFSASSLEPHDYTRLMAKYRDGPSTGIVIDSGIGSSGGTEWASGGAHSNPGPHGASFSRSCNDDDFRETDSGDGPSTVAPVDADGSVQKCSGRNRLFEESAQSSYQISVEHESADPEVSTTYVDYGDNEGSSCCSSGDKNSTDADDEFDFEEMDVENWDEEDAPEFDFCLYCSVNGAGGHGDVYCPLHKTKGSGATLENSGSSEESEGRSDSTSDIWRSGGDSSDTSSLADKTKLEGSRKMKRISFSHTIQVECSKLGV